MRKRIIALAIAFAATSASATEGYYRAPDIRGDLVVFTAEGDLWAHRLDDGSTTRLTTHPALETGASISPDGSRIAYVADYEGVREAYVMPVAGGVPKRVTFELAGVAVQGWSRDGRILYSTAAEVSAPRGVTLKTVDPDALDTDTIPLSDAADGSLDAAGEYVYFSQFGLRFDNAAQYRGGMRGKLWRYRLGSGDEAERLAASHPGNIRRPIVSGDRLYFLSDASGRENLWLANLDGADARQVTFHDDYSVRHAGIDGDRLVYRRGADLYVRDLSSSESERLDIRLTSDHPSLREAWINEPLEYLTSARLAGDGDKVTITARGRIAIAGTDQRRLVNVATPIGSRMRHAALSRDGQWVYAVSDSAGELDLWRYSASGADVAEQLTEGGETLRGRFFESPDGQWIAHDDGRGGLWLLHLESRRNTQIIEDGLQANRIDDLSWSPDSTLFAVSYRAKGDARPRLLLYGVDGGNEAKLTSDKYVSGEPVFSQDGKWLYFLSNRNFEATSSVWADRDFGPSFDNQTLVFAYSLIEDATFPFRVPTELTPDNPVTGEGDEEPAEPPVEVLWDGLSDRLWQVPVAAGNYTDIQINKKFLYLLTSSADGGKITAVPIEPEPEAKQFTEGAAAMMLSDDGAKLLVVRQAEETTQMYIVPAGEEYPEDAGDHMVRTDGWQFSIDPRVEWQQLFHDAWLMHREQFYDPDMRGVDWAATKQKYAALLERATDRYEVNDVLGQMTGELNALHSAVRGGDVPSDPEAPEASALGAALSQTEDGVQIRHIYYHDPEVPADAPPLARPGVDAADGDIIVAINGSATNSLESVHRALRNQAGKQVLLALRRGRDEIRTVVVPAEADDEYNYRYSEWVQRNRLKVDAADSEIGYLHIRNMVAADVAAFAREFYALQDKKGIVIDVRRNGGGNVDSWIIDRLMRKAWMFWAYRTDDPYFNMQNAYRGHLAVIADEGTYSDGETFVAAIKALDIAPVIGVRTAGAGVWLSGRNRLSDFGIARVAEFPVFAMDGRWIVEGYGVTPTIEVGNLPHATYVGTDSQLDAAMEYLRQKIESEPVPDVIQQPFPPVSETARDIVD